MRPRESGPLLLMSADRFLQPPAVTFAKSATLDLKTGGVSPVGFITVSKSACACAGVRQTYCAALLRVCTGFFKKKVVKRLRAYLAVNFALLLQEDVRLGGQRHDVPDDRDGGRTGGKSRRPPLLDQLTDQQHDEQQERQTGHPEQSLVPGRGRQRLRLGWKHLRTRVWSSAAPAGLTPVSLLGAAQAQRLSSCKCSIPRL